MNKSILLINPAFSERDIKSPIGAIPPLGLITNASYIPKNYDIQLVDETIQRLKFDKLNPDLVAISVSSMTARHSYEISKKFTDKGIPVVLGGIHPSLVPDEAKNHASSIVIGNGENVWNDLLRDFENNNLKKVYTPGLFNLAESRIPRRDLLKKYLVDSIETVRGCPFNCNFCSVTKFQGSQYRFKPLNIVEKDLNSIKSKRLILVDDNFLGASKVAEERAINLLKLLKNYNLNWAGQTSINVADNPEVLKLSQESGAISFLIGFESINNNFLKASNKVANLKKGVKYYKSVIKKIHDYGISVLGYFIIGTDYDTKESLRELKEFFIDSEIDMFATQPLTPLPGTSLYEQFKKEKRLFNNSYWMENPYPIFTFKPKKISIEELVNAGLDILDSTERLGPSIKRFINSYKATHNFAASSISFLRNIVDYYNRRKLLNNYIKNH